MSEFKEIARIEDPDGIGLVASITKRDRAGGYRAFSFSVFKVWTDKAGETRNTSYLNARHIPALRKLLSLVEQYIALEQDKLDTERRKQA